jgi:hypothetical protein
MAQTGYTPILIYSSTTASQAPSASNLTNSTLGSELAINITDGKLFYKDNSNAVQVIGWKTVPATAGGTGQTSYAVGDLLYADTTTSLAKLADVATGNALISGGVGVAPSWGKIGLTTHVSGTLPIANGGTAQTSFTANYIHYGSFSTSSNLQFDGTNFGVGGAPNAFAGGFSGIQAKTFAMWSGGGVGGQLSVNLYYNGSNRIYIGNGVASEYQQSGGGHYWSTAASGTAGGTVSLTQLMGLDTNGNQTLNTGNWVQGTAAKGINFTANTAAAGKTSQLLNWYEEGTWTPAVAAGSISGTSITYQGTYTRIGRAVTITFKASNSSNDIVVGSYVVFSGLPYTATYGGTSFTSTEDIDFKRGGEMNVSAGAATLNIGASGANPGTSTLFGSLTYIV